MDFRHLKYFLAVAEHGSLQMAARRLGITQPALTKAIRRIEDSVGVRLFDRHAYGVRLNAYGSAFLKDAQDLDQAFHDAMGRMRSLRRGITGLITIAAGPFWQDAVLPGAIAEMRRLRPDVLIKVMSGADDHLRELLKSRRLAFMLSADHPPALRSEPGLVWENLMVDEYRVIADVGHPLHRCAEISPAQLLDYPWILPPQQGNMVGRLRLLLRSLGLSDPVPSVETESIHLKFNLMRGSDYLSYHAMAHLRAYCPDFIRPIMAPGTAAVRHAGLWKREGMSLGPADLTLIDILKRCCDELSRAEGPGRT
ncbi:LysR family transcriptional regulator [Geminicoccus roseus]|uniref:LysR family transcriptional regulator n=1 Tax=Geminicoccus roseus TaxID=404900 RepID=UPI000418D84E|nr:LysR family transcriptional regulator [Geminicoccus roseus]